MQWCVNCNAQAGYPHSDDCPRPKYFGDPDPYSPNAPTPIYSAVRADLNRYLDALCKAQGKKARR